MFTIPLILVRGLVQSTVMHSFMVFVCITKLGVCIYIKKERKKKKIQICLVAALLLLPNKILRAIT